MWLKALKVLNPELYGDVQIDESEVRTNQLINLPELIIGEAEYITDKIARGMDDKVSDDVAGNLISKSSYNQNL